MVKIDRPTVLQRLERKMGNRLPSITKNPRTFKKLMKAILTLRLKSTVGPRRTKYWTYRIHFVPGSGWSVDMMHKGNPRESGAEIIRRNKDNAGIDHR